MRGFIITLFLFLFAFNLKAQSIQSVQDGDWNEASTWNLNRVPNPDDFVKVSHQVSLIQPGVSVIRLEISNYAGYPAGLSVMTNGSFNVTYNLDIFSGNFDGSTYLVLGSKTKMYVSGIYVERSEANGTEFSAGIFLNDEASLTSTGNFTYQYDGANQVESAKEIVLRGQSIMTILGETNLNINTGNIFTFNMQQTTVFHCSGLFNVNLNGAMSNQFELAPQTSFTVDGDANFNNNSPTLETLNVNLNGFSHFKSSLHLASTEANAIVNFNSGSTGNEIIIGEDLSMTAVSDQSIFLTLNDFCSFTLKRDVVRAGGFGNLIMSNNAMWIYGGDGTQAITPGPGAGNDSFNFTNVELAASEEGMMTLQGDLVVTNSFNLNNGSIETHDTSMLILEANATLMGAGPDSYVQGPMIKKNLAANEEFVFPLGHNGKYAPMSIIGAGGRAAAGEFKATYMNCPPPWGGAIATNLDQISDEDHWTLERSEGTDVNVVLHWSDAAAQGINDLSSIVVAMHNPDVVQYPGFPAGWTSIGNGGTTGGTGSGVSGSVMNIGVCPPPWGIEHFTIGSTSSANSLPLEMESFKANLIGEVVDVQWQTSNESNVDQFRIEKSLNGTNFFEIDRILDVSNSIDGGNYRIVDQNPEIGLNYYRIVQIDLDGMISYSAVKSIVYARTSDLVAYPNPVVNEVSMSGSIVEDVREIKIIDTQGKSIYASNIQNSDQLNNMSCEDLNINNPGVYFMEVTGGGVKETVRIVKK